MKNILKSTCFIFFILQSCGSTTDNESGKEELIKRDLQFSEYSKKNGLGKAFIEFADSAAVLLKPDRMPIKGAKSIWYYYSSLNDEHIQLSWIPLDAIVSESNDLGYTYGVYQLNVRDSMSNGTYVTIWKKDRNGEWKYILDSGNEGLGNIK